MPSIDLTEGHLAHKDRLLITAAEAAHMLSMGKSTFWREVSNKNVPAPVKIGSLTRWRVADLQRFTESDLLATGDDAKQGKSLTNGADIPARTSTATPSTFLTPRELAVLTGVRTASGGITRSARQTQALVHMRIPHYVNPSGDILVSRAAIERGETVPLRSISPRGVDLSKVK